MNNSRVAIVGAAGYTGAELIDILTLHPGVELVGLFRSARAGAESDSTSVGEISPRLAGRTDLPILPFTPDALLGLRPDAVFLATPHEASNEIAPALLDAGVVVLDLSGAFRISDAAAHERAYAFVRTPGLDPVYALPEVSRAAIASASLLACPGCYPTASILALRPLADAGLIRPGTRPTIDAISGVSGAGRTPSARTHLPDVSLQPYNVLTHRHQPEIAEHAGTPVYFVPHIAPWDRGILTTIHAELAETASGADVARAFGRYAEELFVRVLPGGSWAAIRAVERTNFCDISWTVDEASGHVVVCAAIDNLAKGASGQAVQAMNVRLGLPETALGPYAVPPAMETVS